MHQRRFDRWLAVHELTGSAIAPAGGAEPGAATAAGVCPNIRDPLNCFFPAMGWVLTFRRMMKRQAARFSQATEHSIVGSKSSCRAAATAHTGKTSLRPPRRFGVVCMQVWPRRLSPRDRQVQARTEPDPGSRGEVLRQENPSDTSN